jgi:uncharacterized protein YbjT (DUF2867 family)
MEGALDRLMFGYFGSKLSAERVVMESSLGWTILRATQFYDLLLIVAQLMTRLPLVPIPAGFQFQPIDSGEVAARMVELALGPPAGLVPDFAGPRTYDAAELLRSYLRLADKRRLLLRLWLPGKAARAVREGAILSPDHAVGRRTWEDFLADRVGSPQVSNARNR